jgi:hypothetical protein
MPGSTLEDTYRRALAARTRARADLAVACVPFLVDSMFRAQKTPRTLPPKEGAHSGEGRAPEPGRGE